MMIPPGRVVPAGVGLGVGDGLGFEGGGVDAGFEAGWVPDCRDEAPAPCTAP